MEYTVELTEVQALTLLRNYEFGIDMSETDRILAQAIQKEMLVTSG